jgi:hypothetical protein
MLTTALSQDIGYKIGFKDRRDETMLLANGEFTTVETLKKAF